MAGNGMVVEAVSTQSLVMCVATTPLEWVHGSSTTMYCATSSSSSVVLWLHYKIWSQRKWRRGEGGTQTILLSRMLARSSA